MTWDAWYFKSICSSREAGICQPQWFYFDLLYSYLRSLCAGTRFVERETVKCSLMNTPALFLDSLLCCTWLSLSLSSAGLSVCGDSGVVAKVQKTAWQPSPVAPPCWLNMLMSLPWRSAWQPARTGWWRLVCVACCPPVTRRTRILTAHVNSVRKEKIYNINRESRGTNSLKKIWQHTQIHTHWPICPSLVYLCLPVGYFRPLQLLSNQTTNQAGRGGSHQQQTDCPLSFFPVPTVWPPLSLSPVSSLLSALFPYITLNLLLTSSWDDGGVNTLFLLDSASVRIRI